MWRSARRLQTRLFLWFLVALGVGFGSMHFVGSMQDRSDSPPTAMHVASKTIGQRATKLWDDPAALEKYLGDVRETVGLDMRVRRDVDALPRTHGRGGVVTFDGKGGGFVPIVKDGTLVGALEFEAGHLPRRAAWVVAFSVIAAFLVLGVGARAVSRRLAWPLEDVADAAERFGAGDLTARTRVAGGRHFVAVEVREVAQAFDQMADRIARVVRDQRELLAAISHELRSPLGRARIALEIARERAGDGGSASIDDVERQLGDVDAILGDLLAAARAGLTDVKPESTRIVPWLRARVAAEPAPPTYELVADGVPEGLELAFDAPLLNRAVHNLLANARAHGHPSELPIETRIEATRTHVTITVRDRGPGFSDELLAKAFEPFVKGDAARTPGSGYGLGLALVRRIAEAHGGRSFARNARPEDGGGAEVAVELPLAPSARKMV
jgi:signal transduction histidine kinase